MSSHHHDRRATALALLLLLAAPLALLAPCLVGPRTYVPFDLAQWPPVSTALAPEQLAAVVEQQNTDVTEVPITFLPELRFARQELAAGRLPEWNPYARTGTPLLATAVVGLLYPLNWLLWIPSDPQDGLALGAYLSFAIAGLLMFGFLRALGLRTAAAAFGGLAFMLSGTLYANAHFYQRLASLIWLPGMLWAIVRATERDGAARVPPLLGLAACLAMTWLAGFPPYAAPITLVAAAWGVARLDAVQRARGARRAGRHAALLALGFALGLGAAAVQLLPMFAFFPESSRPAPTPDSLAGSGFDPAGLLGLILPDPFGHPYLTRELPYETSPLAVWLFTRASWVSGLLFFPTRYNFVEYTLFPGTLVLLLAAVAVVHRGAPFRAFAALALTALVVLSFASSWLSLLHELPGLSRVPANRFIGPAGALLAALAAIGFERTAVALGRRRWLALCVAGSLVSGLSFGAWVLLGAQDVEAVRAWLREAIHAKFTVRLPSVTLEDVDRYVTAPAKVAAGLELLRQNLLYGGVAFLLGSLWLALVPWMRERGRLGAWLALGAAATAVQLFALAYPVNRGRELRFPIDTPVHAFLREQRDLHSSGGGFTVARGHRSPELPFVLPPCTLVPERIRDLNIYTFVDQHSHKPWRRLWEGVDVLYRERWVKCLPDGERLRRPLLDLFGVRFVLSTVPLENAGRRVGPAVRGPQGEVFAYERDSALPRAFVVPEVRALPDEPAVLDALAAPDLDPRAAALVTAADHGALAAPGPAPDQGARRRAVRFERDDPKAIVLRIGDGPAGYLVLGDSFVSGWTATVGDEPAGIARANVCMRAVAVPAGEVVVRFAYRTPRLGAGVVLSALSLLVLALLAAWWWRARRRA